MPRSNEPFDLEAVYDEQIAPLMSKIIEICKEHKLPMFATFQYAGDGEGDGDLCTTNLPFDERAMSGEIKQLWDVVKGQRISPLRMRVTNGDGSVVEETVILG